MSRGRPKGSNGIVSVSLKDLMDKFTPETLIPIRTSFARQVFPDKIVVIKPNISPLTEIAKTDLTTKEENDRIEFKIIN